MAMLNNQMVFKTLFCCSVLLSSHFDSFLCVLRHDLSWPQESSVGLQFILSQLQFFCEYLRRCLPSRKTTLVRWWEAMSRVRMMAKAIMQWLITGLGHLKTGRDWRYVHLNTKHLLTSGILQFQKRPKHSRQQFLTLVVSWRLESASLW